MLILSCFMLALSLAGILWLHGNAALCVLMAVVSVLTAVLSVLGKIWKKIPEKILSLLSVACIAVFVLCGILQSSKAEEDLFVVDYTKRVDSVRGLIDDGKTEKAREQLTALSEKYETTDEMIFLDGWIRLSEGVNANRILGDLRRKVQNKEAEEYYLLVAECYFIGSGMDYDHYAMEKDVLVEGAKKYPDSFLLNYKAGCLCAYKEDYYNAEYYLMQALMLGGDKDIYTPFELAIVYKEMGEEAYAYAMLHLADSGCWNIKQGGRRTAA